MRLIDATGTEITQDLTPFGPAPQDAIALKFADEISDAEWITEPDRLEELRREYAPLAFVARTYEVIGQPKVQYDPDWEENPHYSRYVQTSMKIRVRRDDGMEDDVWVTAGVPEAVRGTAAALSGDAVRSLWDVWGFGDEGGWGGDLGDDAAIIDACREVALQAQVAVASFVRRRSGGRNARGMGRLQRRGDHRWTARGDAGARR